MDWDAIAAVAELAGALAVITTLIYLSYQLRQSNLFAKAEAIRAVTNTYEVHLTHLHSPMLGDILRRGFNDFDALSKDDQTKFNAYHYPIFNHVETVFEMGKLNLIEDHQSSEWMAMAVSVVTTEGGRQWWEHAQKTLSKPVVAAVNELLADDKYEKIPFTELWPWTDVE